MAVDTTAKRASLLFIYSGIFSEVVPPAPSTPYKVGSRLDLLGPRMKVVNCVTVIIQRIGESDITGVLASPARTDAEELFPGIAITRVRSQDFIIDRADYDFGSGPVEPVIGDVIVWDAEKYQVASMGPDQPPFEYTTPTKLRMRVRTDQTV